MAAPYPTYLTEFLSHQHVLSLATYAGDEQPWVSTLYYVVDEAQQLYFVSKKQTAHCQHIHLHPKVSFAIAWHAPNHLKDRRTIQGTGICHIVSDTETLQLFKELHNTRFPEFTTYVTDAILLPKCALGVYRITPTSLKYGDGHYLDEQAPGEIWIA